MELMLKLCFLQFLSEWYNLFIVLNLLKFNHELVSVSNTKVTHRLGGRAWLRFHLGNGLSASETL
jgi:hypothetical protein